MNVRFVRTGQTRVGQTTHLIETEEGAIRVGGISKRKGEMYYAWDNHIGEFAHFATVTYAQNAAIAWYGDREWCKGGCGALVHVDYQHICTPCAAGAFRDMAAAVKREESAR